MALKIYDTLSKEKLEFKPQKEGEVGFYQCGPTVYWTQHIGNMRAMVMSDVINRSLSYLDYKINFVRNYTDVGHLTSDEDEGEDKIEKGAKKEGVSPKKLSEKYISIFENDLEKLNILTPTHRVKATEHIGEMIKMIEILLEKGYAYETDLAVYFDVSKAKNYTRLSGQNTENNRKGAGVGEIVDSKKKNPQDFSLWFFKAGKHKNAIQTWKSPFHSSLVKNGEGFPGWHIECSAMSKKYIGPTLDIHMGGVEHIPIHHTNEIAQSEAANGVEFVKYWMHNEHLLSNNKKMSKSEGTSFTISDVEKRGFNPIALRYFFLQAHYRSQQNFTWEALSSAQKGLEHLYKQIGQLKEKTKKPWYLFWKREDNEIDLSFKNKFIEKISDDFNIPQALSVLSELLKSEVKNKSKLATILDFDKILGLQFDKIKDKNFVKDTPLRKLPEKIQSLIQERDLARKNKDYKKSDELRDILFKLGYLVKDTSGGQKIIKK